MSAGGARVPVRCVAVDAYFRSSGMLVASGPRQPGGSTRTRCFNPVKSDSARRPELSASRWPRWPADELLQSPLVVRPAPSMCSSCVESSHSHGRPSSGSTNGLKPPTNLYAFHVECSQNRRHSSTVFVYRGVKTSNLQRAKIMASWNISRDKVLTKDEIRRVLADLHRKAPRSINTRLNLTLFRLATCCGLRASELCGLVLDDVRVASERPTIRVPKAIAKGHKARIVPLSFDQGTLDDLGAWKAFRQSRAHAVPISSCVRSTGILVVTRSTDGTPGFDSRRPANAWGASGNRS